MALPTTTLKLPTTTLNYDIIFSTNSPRTPYTWLDKDYLTGWHIVGSTPPAREQFDALQRFTDERFKFLKDVLDYYKDYDAYLHQCDIYLDKEITKAKKAADAAKAAADAAKTAADAAKNAADAAKKTAEEAKDAANNASTSTSTSGGDENDKFEFTNFKFAGWVVMPYAGGSTYAYASYTFNWKIGKNITSIKTSGIGFQTFIKQIPYVGNGSAEVSVYKNVGDWKSAVTSTQKQDLIFTAEGGNSGAQSIKIPITIPAYNSSHSVVQLPSIPEAKKVKVGNDWEA